MESLRKVQARTGAKPPEALEFVQICRQWNVHPLHLNDVECARLHRPGSCFIKTRTDIKFDLSYNSAAEIKL